MTAFTGTSVHGYGPWRQTQKPQDFEDASGANSLERIRAIGDSLKMTRKILEGIVANQNDLKAKNAPRKRYFETDEWKLKIQLLLANDHRSDSERDAQCILFEENYKLFKSTLEAMNARRTSPGCSPPLSYEDLLLLGQQYKTMISYHPLLGDYANRIYAQHLGYDTSNEKIDMDKLFANMPGFFGQFISSRPNVAPRPNMAPRPNVASRPIVASRPSSVPIRSAQAIPTPPIVDNLSNKSNSTAVKPGVKPAAKPAAKPAPAMKNEDETSAAATALMFLGQDASSYSQQFKKSSLLGARGGVSKVRSSTWGRGQERPLSKRVTHPESVHGPSAGQSFLDSPREMRMKLQESKGTEDSLQSELLSIIAMSKSSGRN
jgi:hypothetical protein